MRFICYFMLIICILPMSTLAQEENLDMFRPFIYLKNGTLLRHDQFQISRYSPKFTLLNGEVIKMKEIKFYQEMGRYYANMNGTFLPRIKTGTFDIFALYRDTSTPQPIMIYAYAKGFGEIKQLTYQNLKSDIGFFPNNNHPDKEQIILNLLEKGRSEGKKYYLEAIETYNRVYGQQ